ncbi:MAG TPA: type II secretion system protein [Planctomycetaceae bacterium]|nr:type II secretion system protein [Planctomycetaceae bacterium]
MTLGTRDHHHRPHRRTAFTLFELMLAMMLLGVIFSVFVPMLLTIAHERRDASREQIALQHAANVLEVVTLRPWTELQDPLMGPELSPAMQRVFVDFEQTISVAEVEGTPASKRITVSLTWEHRSGQRTSPLTLHGWVTAPQEPQP